MCNLSQGIRNEGRMEGLIAGRAEGREEGLAKGKVEGKAEGLSEAVMSLMHNMDLSMEKALDALNITEDIRPTVMKFIEDKR